VFTLTNHSSTERTIESNDVTEVVLATRLLSRHPSCSNLFVADGICAQSPSAHSLHPGERARPRKTTLAAAFAGRAGRQPTAKPPAKPDRPICRAGWKSANPAAIAKRDAAFEHRWFPAHPIISLRRTVNAQNQMKMPSRFCIAAPKTAKPSTALVEISHFRLADRAFVWLDPQREPAPAQRQPHATEAEAQLYGVRLASRSLLLFICVLLLARTPSGILLANRRGQSCPLALRYFRATPRSFSLRVTDMEKSNSWRHLIRRISYGARKD